MIINIAEPIPGAPHFSWWEFTHTVNRNFIEQNQQVPVAFQPAGEALGQKMEEVRALFDAPVHVHSAWRGPALNDHVGGSTSSQHMRFEACDFHVSGHSLFEVFERIRSKSIHYGQLILEGLDPSAGLASWVHISLGHPWRARERCMENLHFSIRTRKYTHV